MTFEEFFAKKKIDLPALEKAEPSLFSEFKTHYGQMGEKSFDHTKKYWFNKLRLQYHLTPLKKEEKVIIENKLAEQTIADTLTETAPSPAVGFKPRFKPGMAKPVEQKEETKPEPEQTPPESSEQAAPAPALGFKPKFKAGLTKPIETATSKEETPEKPAEEAEQSKPTPLGFKPKFKAGITKPAEPAQEPNEEPKTDSSIPPKLGFTPKFKAGVTKTVAPPDEKAEQPETKPSEQEKPAEDGAPKPAYKPRFNMKNIKPKQEE